MRLTIWLKEMKKQNAKKAHNSSNANAAYEINYKKQKTKKKLPRLKIEPKFRVNTTCYVKRSITKLP